MGRVVIIGNAGGGKSTLARRLAEQDGLRHIEIDKLLWQPGWKLTPTDVYDRQHDEIIEADRPLPLSLSCRHSPNDVRFKLYNRAKLREQLETMMKLKASRHDSTDSQAP